ncbi:MAG: hemerythrin domain-containing protein [Bacteroidia bacterium]|nr:hemerythrin domain-containing protein [Bacteroidia bacterium]
MEIKKPIKRSAAIVEFSKDHHFALLLVWKIKEGLKRSIDSKRISKYVIHFFDIDLIHHFADEEKFLFSKLPSNNPLRIQAEEEHKNIKQMVDELKQNSENQDLLKSFAEALEKHIRFEERELFNHLQENVSDNVLKEIASSVKPREHEADGSWDDPFWKTA